MVSQKTKDLKIASGLCIHCSSPAEDGKRMCTNHRLKYNKCMKSHRDRKQGRVVAKKCKYYGCNMWIVDPGAKYCGRHTKAVAREHAKKSVVSGPRVCKVEGCSVIVGKWRSFCDEHRRQRNYECGLERRGWYRISRPLDKKRKKKPPALKGTMCSLCGWNLASVDHHRIVAGKRGGTYSKNNCIPVCPNHHRLAHHNSAVFLRDVALGVFLNYPIADAFWEVAESLEKVFGPMPAHLIGWPSGGLSETESEGAWGGASFDRDNALKKCESY